MSLGSPAWDVVVSPFTDVFAGFRLRVLAVGAGELGFLDWGVPALAFLRGLPTAITKVDSKLRSLESPVCFRLGGRVRLGINVVSVKNCGLAVFTPVMLGQSGGKIINLSGAGATNAWSNMSAYCSSKAAVVRLTEVLAQELDGKGIAVHALGPGSVHTGMWDKMTEEAAQAGADFIHELGLRVTSGGGASIDECAELAVWLASDESGALTGRLISAATDDFRALPPRIAEIMAGDAFTLRRVGLD